MYINVASKAQKLFSDFQQAEKEKAKKDALANPLFSWHVTYFTTNRKKNLVFLNDATNLVVVLHDVNAKNKQQVKERFERALKSVWVSLGLSNKLLTEYLAVAGDWQINKSVDRSTMGSLVLLCDYAAESREKDDELSTTLTMNQPRKKGKQYLRYDDTVKIFKSAAPFKYHDASQSEEKSTIDKGQLKETIKALEKLSGLDIDMLSDEQADRTVSKIQRLNNQLIDCFITDIQKQYSNATVRRYKNDLDLYLNEWIAYHLHTIFNFETVNVGELLYHNFSLWKTKQIRKAMKNLLKFLDDQGVIAHDWYLERKEYLNQEIEPVAEDDDLYFSDDDDSWETADDSFIHDEANPQLATIFDQQTDTLIDDYLASFASLYGIIPVRQAFQIISDQNTSLNLSKNKFDRYIEDRVGENELRYLVLDLEQIANEIGLDTVFDSGLYIVYPTIITDSNRLAALYNHQLGLQYYVPQKDELLRYRYDDYYDKQAVIDQLKETFMTKYELSGSRLQGAIFVSLYGLKFAQYEDLDLRSMGDSVKRVIKMLHDSINLDMRDKAEMTNLVKILFVISSSIRRPWNRGWTSEEMAEKPNISKLFDFGNPSLSPELKAAIKGGRVDRQELIYLLEDSNLPVKEVRKLAKEIKGL